MSIEVQDTSFHVKNLRMRHPFGFGSVTLQQLPHVFLTLSAEIDGTKQTGIAADHAIPKWFVKDPDNSIADDVRGIVTVLHKSGSLARTVRAPTVFEFWHRLYGRVMSWADEQGYPPLLAGFGVSFVERAVIDAYTRANGTTFSEAVRSNAFGVRPGAIYEELDGAQPADYLSERQPQSLSLRHTVGLEDTLVSDGNGDDGLPTSLQSYVERDGIRFFKCKVSGDPNEDIERLVDISAVINDSCGDYGVTLDANEGYSLSALRELWTMMNTNPALDLFRENLICIEQPLDRDVALSEEAGDMLSDWDGPPVIIDESDGELTSLETALDRGYAGTSFKSCKGVFKGLVNACLLEHRDRRNPQRTHLLTAEDLTTIGPVSLLQDLTAIATLGLGHAERNGHHYFRGLSEFPQELQDWMVKTHGDLYRRHEDGFATLDVTNGEIRLDSVLEAPYGVATDIQPLQFTPLEQWRVESLDV